MRSPSIPDHNPAIIAANLSAPALKCRRDL